MHNDFSMQYNFFKKLKWYKRADLSSEQNILPYNLQLKTASWLEYLTALNWFYSLEQNAKLINLILLRTTPFAQHPQENY